MQITEELAQRMLEEDIYFYHKRQRRMFRRVAGEEELYYAKFSGEEPVLIARSSRSVTDALIFGKEVTREEFENFYLPEPPSFVMYQKQAEYDEIMRKVYEGVEVYITNSFEGLAFRLSKGRVYAKFHKGKEYEFHDRGATDQATDILYNAYSEANEISKEEYENF